MLATIHTLNILLPVFYAATFFVYLYDFIKDDSNIANSKRIFLFVTLLTHTFYVVARTLEFDHTPITNKFEIFTLLACTISCAYFILELLTDVRGTGVFIIFLSLVFQILSSLFITDLREVADVLRNHLLGLHVISAMLGYSGFTLAAVYGLLYILLYKDIKLKKFGLIFKRLPSLEMLEKLCFNSVVIGFVLLSFAIAIGIAWLPSTFPNFSIFDSKIISTILIWFVFAFMIVAKFAAKWQGKKVVRFSLLGFLLMLISNILMMALSSSFHKFY